MKRVMCNRSVLVLLAVAIGASWDAMPASAQTMIGLGTLPGATYRYSQALGVSRDGSTVVGTSINGQEHFEAFAWTASTGMVGLGFLPGSSVVSSATGVSADGSTVVGSSENAAGHNEAFIWTAANGMVGLGILPGYSFSAATGVSADGSTIVGWSGNSQGHSEAFIWTAATGIVGLGFLPSGIDSFAAAISADGSTVVGDSNLGPFLAEDGNEYDVHEAFKWTEASGMVGLGTLPYLSPWSRGMAVSENGSTVVGQSIEYTQGFTAFHWTAATGMIGLGSLPIAPFPYSNALGVSADGSTVVGSSLNSENLDEAFVWTSASGMTGLGTLPGDLHSRATGVSGDGMIAVGYSFDAAGFNEAFLVQLKLPTPSELVTALIEQVLGLNLQHGIENSLDSKLDAAFRALDDVNENNDIAAINALDAFINAVRAQRGRHIPAAAADALIAAALEIVELLGE